MASALDPLRETVRLARELDRALAARRVERAARSPAAKAGWRARRHDPESDPMMSDSAAARLREILAARA